NITIAANTSTTFNVVITGGTSPYTINYTRNGTAQTAVTGYINGANISTGVLTAGTYVYTLTSVRDANGCYAQNTGTSITIVALGSGIGELRVRSNIIVFNAKQGQALSAQQSINIFSANNNTLNWTHTIDVPWIIPDKQNGVTDDVLKVGINTTGLQQGIHNGNITFTSPQSTGGPVVVPVTLIVNPDVPVKPTTWKDDHSGVMSVTVDDGLPTAFEKLQSHGFQGSYFYHGTTPPSYYSDFFSAGMELGSHLTTHSCVFVSESNLQYQEIEPNMAGLCSNIPQACNEFITLAWPCGKANFLEENVAAKYFLAARGGGKNSAQQLESSSPENMMELKTYYPGYYPDMPDQKLLVDQAITQKKWLITCLHDELIDDGSIDYSASKDIWVTSIGKVIKYILQRDRYILNNYIEVSNSISFNLSRLAIPSSENRNFETSFTSSDVTTIEIDIDEGRTIQNVLVDGSINTYQIKNLNGNNILIMNIKLEPSVYKMVEVIYSSGSKSDNSGTANPNLNKYEDEKLVSEDNILEQNYPNPFNDNTWIEFYISNESQVIIEIYNSFGQKVETVLSQKLKSGRHKINWDSGNFTPGCYYLMMRTEKYIKTIKIVIT
ncbi:MAG: T9SS type A sorting domain-containing protein, partial [Bacteroidales bacterium]|nr:T9SS type A sorting domain-containing protein [Bacteroidales bacterium]